jgi:glucose 1-dehydrogenase
VQLRDKVAIVTGADTGIGKAIALRFIAEGAAVCIDYYGDRTLADRLIGEIANTGGRAIAVGADVANPDDARRLVQTTVDALGGLDVLVNNAGIEEKHPFLETPLDVWSKVIAVNLTGAWLCTQEAAKAMAARKRGGRIINISSVHENVAMPTNAPYCASKGGVRMLMRTLAVELAQHNITVNDVAPGAIDTPMDASLERRPEEMEALLAEIPLRRMGRPEEVAALCAWLASDEAAYVTGATYVIDGGMSQRSGSL